MSRRSQTGYKPLPPNEHRPVAPPLPPGPKGPTTLADVKKLPIEEQRKVLAAELAGIDRAIERMHLERATIHGALSMIED